MKNTVKITKGVNLGGWFSQCNHSKAHYDTFITKSDIEKISSWGLDHIRVPFDYELLENEDGEPIDENFRYIDSCIEWCKEYNLRLILDLHKAFGYSFINAYKNDNNLFTSELLQQRYINFWARIAKRYGMLNNTVVFELLNEIVETHLCEPWNKLSKRTISEIRKYAPDSKIIIGGTCWNSIASVTSLGKPSDKNIIYNFHCYEPLVFTHQNAYWVDEIKNIGEVQYPLTKEQISDYLEILSEPHKKTLKSFDFDGKCNNIFIDLFKEAVTFTKEQDIELYCGEYGVIDKADVQSTVRWFKDINTAFNQYGIGRCVWSYKEMDFGITDEHYRAIFNDLVKYL